MPSPPRSRSGYLPSLDGWRAVAILAVIAVHDAPIVVAGHSLRLLQNYGSLGVVLFFAISGILIPWRILEEEWLTGRFHLQLFYVRRLFRIQPAALVYLATVALLAFLGVISVGWNHWCGALFMYENFLFHNAPEDWTRGNFTGHFWTLAVEEHFYLLVSLAFFFIRRHRLRIFVVALVVIKLTQFFVQHATPDPLLRRTYWQIHVLLWPTTAALRCPAIRPWAERWLQAGPVLALTAALGAVLYVRSRGTLLNLLEYAFTPWVVATMLHPTSWPTRILEWRPLRFLGRISYSFYLWHVLFFTEGPSASVHSRLLLLLSQRPCKYICSLVAAVASYYLIEKPMIRLGHRLAPPATAGHKDLLNEPTLPPDSQPAMVS